MNNQIIFTGNSNPDLAQRIADNLNTKLGAIKVDTFSDGEINVEIQENVRGKDTFIIQSTNNPAHKNIMELVLIADALKRASARSITAVIPYFGYSRQDRRVRSARVPISAKVVADMLSNVGISRVITLDIHSEQLQGFFAFPVDNIYTANIMVKSLKDEYDVDELQVVSPDTGGVIRARSVAKTLEVKDLAIIDKRREKANESEVINLIGEVEGKVCIVPDDLPPTPPSSMVLGACIPSLPPATSSSATSRRACSSCGPIWRPDRLPRRPTSTTSPCAPGSSRTGTTGCTPTSATMPPGSRCTAPSTR